MIEPFSFEKIRFETHFIKTEIYYRRYKITPNGISPSGIPGYGEGIVIANGNEHDEWGDTEKENLNTTMAEKSGKRRNLFEDIVSPKIFWSRGL